MILSDRHEFAFVHVPKCAGTLVRKALEPIDDSQGRFNRIGEHPGMGKIHFSHITLSDLERFFPEEFGKVARYRSVAILRDPVDRFFSALFQRLREFKGYQQSQITGPVIAQEADFLMESLSRIDGRLPLEYVHFNRQADFVLFRGAQLVDRLFALENLDAAAAFVAERTGVRIAPDVRENRTAALRWPALRPVARLLRAPYAAIVPYAARNRLRSELTKIGLYGDVEKHRLLRPGSPLDAFLRRHYREDFRLHAIALGAS